VSENLGVLLSRAVELRADLLKLSSSDQVPAVERDRLLRASGRLSESAIRPLASVATPADLPAGSSQASVVELGDRLKKLAVQATEVRVRDGHVSEVQEATAALQDLACEFAAGADRSGLAALLASFVELQRGLKLGIQIETNGPYLVTNADCLANHLGERIAALPQMALCRCGGSAIKPLCDGTHARIAFQDAKDSKRVPDRRDTYLGQQQLAILDNRGTCAHSGLCTDRLPSVFHVGKEPFVTPSGGRMDEIVRATRSCPSGALSHSIAGHETDDQVRDPGIEVSKDGPYRITGGIPLARADGSDEPRNEGATREHYSLCRCGHSQNKPFCSGMHWYVSFKDPRPPADHEPTVFEWAGGYPALVTMTRIFYSKYVPQDPLLSPLFANMSPDHPERVASWLGEVFGGPKFYSGRYGGYERMLSQHAGKGLTEAQRARWVALLCQSADDARLPNDAEFRAAFVSYLEWGSRLAVENSTPGAKPPPHMPMPRWWWVCNATPGSRRSAVSLEPEPEQVVTIPGPDETVSYSRHIKSMFRQMDRDSMKFAFDLWSHDDVTMHAQAILQRLEAGTMPCDGAWPSERVEAFRRWVQAGTPD
jgi:CDGSH-type Zn-finger protein/truncated hemoglobin YjbI